MKKLRLDPEALRVDSFEAEGGAADGRGTVHANATTLCTRWASCYGTCPGTCERDSCYSCSLDSYCETVAYSCAPQPSCAGPDCVAP